MTKFYLNKLNEVVSMFRFYCIITILLLKGFINGEETTTHGDSGALEEDEDFKYDDRDPHCFRFTWIGSEYNNDTKFSGNETCKGLIERKKLKNTPCKQPLVITYDGTPPNLTYLYKNHRDEVLCRRATGESCIKYSYYFNEQLWNVTYACSKVRAINEGSVTSGCYSQFDSGFEIQVCVCQSQGSEPCNNSHRYFISRTVISFYLILFFYNTNFVL